MQRNNPETSLIADKLMTKELRAIDNAKILDALVHFPNGAIYTDIALHLGWDDKSKVSRRMKEILDEPNSKLCLTGEKRLTPSNRPAMVYKLLKDGESAPTIEKEHYMANQTSAADYANLLIAGSKNGRLEQKSLFTED